MSSSKKLKMVTSNIEVAAGRPAAPDPEVRAVAKRRQFSAAYKPSMLAQAAKFDRIRGDRGVTSPREAVQLASGDVAARARNSDRVGQTRHSARQQLGQDALGGRAKHRLASSIPPAAHPLPATTLDSRGIPQTRLRPDLPARPAGVAIF